MRKPLVMLTVGWAIFATAAAGSSGSATPATTEPVIEVLPTWRITSDDRAVLDAVSATFEIRRRLPEGGYEVIVPAGKESGLLRLVPDATPYNPDLHAELRRIPKGAGIYDVPSMERRLRAFAATHPTLVKLETYGTSIGGLPEYVLTMAKDPQNPDPAKPAVMITAATHGDEVVTVEVVLGLIERLLNSYGKDERLTRLVDGLTIHWIPALCVDGYAARSRTVQGRDPNRDFAWPENPDRQPQTQCIQHATAFFHSHPEVRGSIDYHASGSMIMFPWAYTYTQVPAADYRMFDTLTGHMAAANGFVYGPISRVIYVAKGSSADYYYWKRGTVSLGIEVSHNLAPDKAELGDIVTENAESTWRFLDHFLN